MDNVSTRLELLSFDSIVDSAWTVEELSTSACLLPRRVLFHTEVMGESSLRHVNIHFKLHHRSPRMMNALAA